jgi:hypothetical protein
MRIDSHLQLWTRSTDPRQGSPTDDRPVGVEGFGQAETLRELLQSVGEKSA